MDRSDGSFCPAGPVCWYAENTIFAVKKSTFWLEFNKIHKLKIIDTGKEGECGGEEGQCKDD